MAQIPSPSLHEEKIIAFVEKYCAENKLSCEKDYYGNLYINVPATDPSKKPLLFTAHMDVIGDASPVEVFFDGDLIRAKGRTLGADDKVGVAQALLFAKGEILKKLPEAEILNELMRMIK